MTKKRIIRVCDEDGNVLYQGADKRYYDGDYNPKEGKLFGMFTIKEVVQAAVFLVLFGVFLLRMDERQKLMEQNILYLTEFTANSDNWQSTVYGTQFKSGKPLNDAYVESLIKKNIKNRGW